MKRYIAVIVAVLLLAAGCGQKDNGTAGVPTGAGEPTEAVQPTTVPEPTEGSQPEVTNTEQPTTAPEPTKTPDPTPTPEPTPEPTALPEVTPIGKMLEEYGMRAGTCLSDFMVKDKKCLEIITTHFNSITMENLMKPDYTLDRDASIAAGDLVVSFNDMTLLMLDWARDNGMAVRGHTIIWHSQTPKWIFHENFDVSQPFVTREVMLTRMESYVRQVFEKLTELGYIDLFYAYDVVNEAWMEDGSIRKEQNYWHQIIGDDYLWYAFSYADKYAPENIDLFYNDYNEQFKTETLVNFVKTLVDEDGRYLIDGIGLQAHLYTADDIDNYLKTVETLGATGLKVDLTELDVCLGTWQSKLPATEENLKIQGQYYYNLIHGLLELVQADKVNMDSLTFWGFADSLSWRKNASPLLYNSKYEPKYAFYGAAQVKELAGFDE